MSEISREEVEAKIALANAQTDTKFAELRTDLSHMESRILLKLGEMPTKTHMFLWYTTVFAIALAVVGAVFLAASLTESKYLGFLARIPVTVQALPAPSGNSH